MLFNKNLIIFIIFLTAFGWFSIHAQDQTTTIEILENKIKLNEPLVISVIVKNDENKPNYKFPELKGFSKRGVSIARIPVNINGKSTIDQKVSQEYMPIKAGAFNFSNINIQINDETVIGPSFSITVSQSEVDETEENFKDFIDGSAYEFVDVKDDAFFAITTNKLKPYVGEGFLITVAFYIAQSNKAEMDFTNENGQLDAILKQIRPKNCWEENLGISEIKSSRLIKIGDKKYFQYKIFQAVYYPFNNLPITIGPMKWQMVKYKIAKDQEVSKSKIEDYKTFLSKSIVIKPVSLPKSENISTDFVGDYWLEQVLDKEKVQTGKSFNYSFIVKGVGNLSVLKFPEVLSDSLFEIYEPKISQQITSNLGKVIAEKTFSFDIVPKFAGKFKLKDYFSINYFNFRTKSYEILQADKAIEVVGVDIANENVPIANENDLFENLNDLKSDEKSFDFRSILLQISNILVIAMLFAMIYIVWPSKK
jgi:BatD DUF11 like domain